MQAASLDRFAVGLTDPQEREPELIAKWSAGAGKKSYRIRVHRGRGRLVCRYNLFFEALWCRVAFCRGELIMAMVIAASTRDMTREQWLEERRKGIGGSDAAAIAGLSPWKSPVAVWLEKTGQVEPEEPGEAAYWGTVLEDVVARNFQSVQV